MAAQPVDTVALHFQHNVDGICKDLSGVVLMPDGTLWVASDETRSVERLSFHNGRFEHHRSFDLGGLLGLPPGNFKEFDLEGLDQDGDFLWLVGGFGARRKGFNEAESDAENILRFAKVEAEPDRCLLARVPLVDGELVSAVYGPPGAGGHLRVARLTSTGEGNSLVFALADDEHLGRFVKADIPSKDNGLDVEALSVSGDRIFVGLRGPVLRGWSILLEVKVEENSTGILGLKPIGPAGRTYRKYFLDLEGLGFRDLCRDGSDLLILAGPSVSLDGPARIYRLAGAADLRDDVLHRPKPVLDLPHGRGEDHPEGMTLTISPSGRRSALVVYDGPIASGKTHREGGHNYEALIRKTPRKPIRAFLQDGANDLENANGNWPLANQQTAGALAFAGYDYKFVFGDGFHSNKHCRAILPDSLRWLWRGWAAEEPR